jgi:hypothetical protein
VQVQADRLLARQQQTKGLACVRWSWCLQQGWLDWARIVFDSKFGVAIIGRCSGRAARGAKVVRRRCRRCRRGAVVIDCRRSSRSCVDAGGRVVEATDRGGGLLGALFTQCATAPLLTDFGLASTLPRPMVHFQPNGVISILQQSRVDSAKSAQRALENAQALFLPRLLIPIVHVAKNSIGDQFGRRHCAREGQEHACARPARGGSNVLPFGRNSSISCFASRLCEL